MLRTVILVLSVLVAAACSDTGLLDVSAGSDATDFRAHLRKTLPGTLNAEGVPGVAVALIEGGQVVWEQGFGFADPELGTPVDPSGTVFQVASLSKPLVAWGVARLAEEGRLDLDAPIESYLTRWHFPPSSFDASQVTARRLLSHTAGTNIHGYLGFEPDHPLPTLVESLEGATLGLGPLELISAPGERWLYSGGGYTVLQLAIEEITGQPFEQYMRDQVLIPLGLTHSSFDWSPTLQARTATPYSFTGERLPAYRYTAKAAAGLYTTLHDYARFVTVELDEAGNVDAGNLLARETVASLHQPAERAVLYGLGHQRFTAEDGRTLIGHAGLNRGWRAFWLADLEGDRAIVVLSNSQHDYDLPSRVVCAWSRAVVSSRIALPQGIPGCS